MDPVTLNNDTPQDSNIPTSNKRTSNVWNYFEKVEEVNSAGGKVFKAKCAICKIKLSCCGTAGTSHLTRHVKSHVNAQSKSSDMKNQMLLAMNKSGALSNYNFDNEKARSEVVDFIIRAELPFTFVDSHDFVGMIQRGFAPAFKKFSSQTCKRDVMKQYVVSKTALIEYFDNFKGKISFTSDMWSSRQKMGYMSLTAHWIDDDWCMQKRILSFKMIEYPHTGESLAAHAYEELISWHLHEKVLSFTLDNASSNDVLIAQLSSHLMLNDVSKNISHVRCTCHILNLIVQDGLSCLSTSIEKITAIVRSMNSSIKRHELWLNACAELGLKKRNIDNDVPHRWNSTYDLLQVAVKYKTALNRYCQKVNESKNCSLSVPAEHDWVIASLCMNFLAIFSTTTKICSGVYAPTSNKVINSLADIYDTFKAYQPLVAFKPALDAMKLKFDKYWDDFPMIFCLATVLDPRFKLLAIETWLHVYDLTDFEVHLKDEHVKSTLDQLYEIYKRNVLAASAVLPTELPACISNATSVIVPNSIDVNIPVVHSNSMARLKRAKIGSSNTTCSDLQLYLEMDTWEFDESVNFNLLGWWKGKSCSYPILSLLAKDILSIPASTVASEAAFSTGGRVISEKRASLSPSTIEALICLKDWSLAHCRKQDAAAEEAAAEELMQARASRPDWIQDEEVFNVDAAEMEIVTQSDANTL